MKFRSFIVFNILVFSGIIAHAQDAANTPENAGNTQDGSSSAASFTRGYTLGPGDQVAGRVLGEAEYDFVATVDENGMIEVPFVKKPVVAQCKTERELRSELTDVLKTYLRDPQLSFRISEKHSRPTVSVAGEIMKQMEITLTRKATLIEILSVAGGIKEEASGEIQVFRPKPPLCMAENDPDNWKSNSSDPTDLPSRTYSHANVQLGKEDSNPTIYPGDRIFVKKAPPVYVTGQVVAGQGVYLKENGLSLTDAIGMVGGPRPEANKNNIAIYRLKSGSNPASRDRELISANFKLIREGKQKDILLQPYDIVVADKAKKPIGLTIAEFALSAGKAAITAGANAIPYRVIY